MTGHVVRDAHDEGDAIARAVVTLLRQLARFDHLIHQAHEAAQTARSIERDCCMACGCLCLPDEQCPGCRAKRAEEEAAA